MSDNAGAIESFYAAFQRGDHATMGALYADDATFSDPVFPSLTADEARAMWRMFCTSGNEIAVEFSNIRADDKSGSAHWEAVYRFPKTGRTVRNRIDAAFLFRDGKIIRHRDDFDLYAWNRMALGPLGTALGWTPLVKNQVRTQAMTQLKRFMRAEEQTPS